MTTTRSFSAIVQNAVAAAHIALKVELRMDKHGPSFTIAKYVGEPGQGTPSSGTLKTIYRRWKPKFGGTAGSDARIVVGGLRSMIATDGQAAGI
jgi:hypothetical protein